MSLRVSPLRKNLEQRFFAELVTPSTVPTCEQARSWLSSNKPATCLATFEWLRLSQRFEMHRKHVQEILAELPNQLDQEKLNFRSLSLLASALADVPSSATTRSALEHVFTKLSGNPEDMRQINRLCRAAVTHRMPSDKIKALLSKRSALSDPDDTRWILAYCAAFSPDLLPAFLPRLKRDAPLLSGGDLVGLMEAFAKMTDFKSSSAAAAVASVKVAALRHVPDMSAVDLASLAFALGRLGMWTRSCGGLVSRHVDRTLRSMPRTSLAKLLVGAIGNKTDQKFLRANTVATAFNRSKFGDIDPLTAARLLWVMTVGNFSAETSCSLDGKWCEPHRAVAVKATNYCETIVKKGSARKLVSQEDRAEFDQLMAEIEASKTFQASSDKAEKEKKNDEEVKKTPILWKLKPVASYPGVFIDVTPTPAALRKRVASAEIAGRKIVDALSWAAMTPPERRKFAKNDGDVVGLFNTAAHAATPLPPWDADQLKLPPQALKWSIRRANAHH